MIIGASLGSFMGLDMDRAMELYPALSREHGLNAVEIRLEREPGRPSLWVDEIRGDFEARLRRFLSGFKACGAHLPFIYLNPVSPNRGIAAESVRQLEAGIETAGRLGLSYALMHATGTAYGVSHGEQLDRWTGILAHLDEIAAKVGVQLTIENGAFLSDLKELADTVRKVDSRLRITLDTGHAYARLSGETDHSLAGILLGVREVTRPGFHTSRNMPFEQYGSLSRFVETERGLIYSLHIHDHNGRRDHLVPGRGYIDFSFLPVVADRPLIIESIFEDADKDLRASVQVIEDVMSRHRDKVWGPDQRV